MNKLTLIENLPLRGRGICGKLSLMKILVLVLSFAAVPRGAWGAGREAAPVPPPAHADGEAVSGVARQPPRPQSFASLKVSLSFEASERGNAEVALGRADASGGLGLSGVRAVAGFDRGVWFLRGDGFGRALERPAAQGGGPSPRTLKILLWLDSGGAPIRLAALEADGAPLALSGEEEQDALSLLDPREWDVFKAVTRGDASSAAATVSVSPAGSSVILR